jgi:hypothetical protein
MQNKRQINMPVNIVEMKLKTQIENNLLNQINTDLKECFNDLEYIYKNHKYVSSVTIEKTICNKITSLENLSTTNNLEIGQVPINELLKKLFNHAYQFYWLFQYFYLKKKDFMGMNLTGLVNGKMETGLSFRNAISKISWEQFICKELGFGKDVLEQLNLGNSDTTSINVYKIKSSSFKWEENGFAQTHDYFWIISDLNKGEYFVMV